MIKVINCTELNALRKDGVEHTLIDVREKDEWDAGHIEGAVLIPLGLLELKAAEALPDKDALIVVHCKSGGRSAVGVQALEKLGYTNVKNLEGGFDEFSRT